MASDGLKLFSDYLCKNAGQIIISGVAAVFGDMASIENWAVYNYYAPYPIYTTTGRIAGANAFVFSGGNAVYNNAVPQMIPTGNNIETDTASNITTTSTIYNPFFMFHDSESEKSYCLQIYANETGTEYGVRVSAYTQQPETNRVTWNYYSDFMDYQHTIYLRSQDVESNHNQVKVYRATISDHTYYIFAFGVSADGTYSTGSIISGGSGFIAFPAEYFEGKIPENSAGKETESNSEIAFTETVEYRGSVMPRDLTGKRNPYGFNAGNGLSLCIITYEEYAAILQGIYAGTAESVLNKISQGFAQIVGGNTHRPADEVNAITKAILCCHMIPQITGFVSGSMMLKTISGYHILGGNGDSAVSMSLWKTANTIFHYDTSYHLIERRLNSFLDFEPYTSIQLHLPFMPVVELKPSAIYGNLLKIHYTIDIFTGILSADIIIKDISKTPFREYVMTTVQTSVKTDIPIMGNAAQNSALSSISSAIIGAAGGKEEAPFMSVGTAAIDTLSTIGTGAAVGRFSVDGIGAYLSNRQPFLIFTRPNPENPSNYAVLNGFTSNMGGVVGDFTGYSVFESVDLSGINATDAEKQEIESLLKGGCFV